MLCRDLGFLFTGAVSHFKEPPSTDRRLSAFGSNVPLNDKRASITCSKYISTFSTFGGIASHYNNIPMHDGRSIMFLSEVRTPRTFTKSWSAACVPAYPTGFLDPKRCAILRIFQKSHFTTRYRSCRTGTLFYMTLHAGFQNDPRRSVSNLLANAFSGSTHKHMYVDADQRRQSSPTMSDNISKETVNKQTPRIRTNLP